MTDMSSRDRLKSAVLMASSRLRDRGSRRISSVGQRTRVASSQATEVVVSRPSDGVFEVRLSGGPRRNVLGRATVDRIESLVEVPPASTRVILFTAEGPDFCAGYDLFEAANEGAEPLLAAESNFAPLRTSSRPLVAALRGHVIGGGLELALAADVRVAATDTTFAIPASHLGLVYSEAGVRLLVAELGESTARAMLLAGRVITAAEALASGLVSELVAPDELDRRARELAARIASWAPIATSGNRRVLDAVTGRTTSDTAALRLSSFAPGGALQLSIDRFTARRTAPEPETTGALVDRNFGTAAWRAHAIRALARLGEEFGSVVRSRIHPRSL